MSFPPTDWGDWASDEYAVNAPATSFHFERWFRNPVAMAQGALGAPMQAQGWMPFDAEGCGPGAAGGRLWSYATDGPSSGVISPILQPGFDYAIRTSGFGAAGVQLGSGSPVTWKSIHSIVGSRVNITEIFNPAVVKRTVLINTMAYNQSSSIDSEIEPQKWYADNSLTGDLARTQIRIAPSVSTINAGDIYLFKRAIYSYGGPYQ